MRFKTIAAVIAGLILSVVAIAFLLYKGMIRFNYPSHEDYPVRGVDVSSWQGEIDWEILAAQDIDFAFIKASEGSSHVDSRFQYNYRNAMETSLRVGAYHFFSYDSPGYTQAQNFISQVAVVPGMLPPVVDVEFYGDKMDNLPDRETTQAELEALLGELEGHYGMTPVIYATKKSYNLYIAGHFDDNPIWIRDVFWKPYLCDNREWTFWQYTDREVLAGYSGAERYIDMNVFNGSVEEFSNF